MSRRPVSLAVVALTAAALSACGTGLHAKTYSEVGRQDGASADVGGQTGQGGVAVRNLHVEPPAQGSSLQQGSEALVTGGLVNRGLVDDVLLSASSDASSSATLTVAGQDVQSVPVPAQAHAPTDWAVRLTGLTRTVNVAEYISVTLQFAHAGRVTLQVPVLAGDNGLSSRTPEQDPYATPEK